MKKVLFSLASLVSIFAFSQNVVFQDDFESYEDFIIENVGDWTLIDMDQLDPYYIENVTFENAAEKRAFQVFNYTATTPEPIVNTESSDWSGHESIKAMLCMAGQPTAEVSANNDWLITPEITLGAGNTVSFWYKAADQEYSQEKFMVGLSTSGNSPDAFSLISDGVIVIDAGDNSWHQFTYQLPDSYNGQSVHFAVICVSDDQFGFMVDDFLVEAETLSVNNPNAVRDITSIYPNPAVDDITVNLSSKFDASKTTVTIYEVSGKKVKTFDNVNSVNVKNLEKGIYILNFSDGINKETKKLLVK